MGVGWIDRVFNNTNKTYYLQSMDARNNGKLTRGGKSFELDGGGWVALEPMTQYQTDWCGIPWFHQGDHFKAISCDKKRGVRFYTTIVEEQNWIRFEDAQRGRTIGQQSAPKGSDFHCYLRIENDGIYVDVVNNHKETAENLVFMILDGVNEYRKEQQELAIELLKLLA